jgi:activator of HSP90 ATPase
MQFSVSKIFTVSPKKIYLAWLNSEKHSAMTGADAHISNKANAHFSAWDGYITGTNIQLISGEKIIQYWRTEDFEDDQDDSIIEIYFDEIPEGTLLTLNHFNLLEKDTSYEQGWIDNYFTPMEEYFDKGKKKK